LSESAVFSVIGVVQTVMAQCGCCSVRIVDRDWGVLGFFILFYFLFYFLFFYFLFFWLMKSWDVMTVLRAAARDGHFGGGERYVRLLCAK
jgi:hypothetical protein